MSFPNGVRLSDSIASKIIEGGFPSDLDGLRFSAALNIWEFVPFGGGGGQTFLAVTKPTDQIVNNSTVFVNDTALQALLTANLNYGFFLLSIRDSSAVADFKWSMIAPAGATIRWNRYLVNVAALIEGATLPLSGLGLGIEIIEILYGQVDMAGTAGNLIMQFAQNTAEVSDTTHQRGSTLVVWQQ